MRKFVLPVLLTLVLLFPLQTRAATAKTYGDLLDNLEKLKQEKIAMQNEAALTESEYKSIGAEIQESQVKVAEYNQEISKKTKEIEDLEIEIQKKKEETEKILVFLEMSNGEKAYLEYVFNATSFTDFIHRVAIVEEISKYNSEQVEEMNALIKKNEEAKKDLADKVKQEEKERLALEEKQRKVGDRINELYSEGATIDERISDQKEIIAYYEAKGCTERSDILSQCSKIPPATGFVRPVSRGIITSDYGFRISPIYGWNEGHSGVDIGGVAVGNPVYPVAAGTVAFKINWNCGGRVLGVHHIVNGVRYTSMYMHLQSFNVNVGDIVSTEDIIAFSGGIYDNCSTGPHLHLTLGTDHITDPGSYRNYIFNPNDVIYFPSGWFYSRTWAN